MMINLDFINSTAANNQIKGFSTQYFCFSQYIMINDVYIYKYWTLKNI